MGSAMKHMVYCTVVGMLLKAFKSFYNVCVIYVKIDGEFSDW